MPRSRKHRRGKRGGGFWGETPAQTNSLNSLTQDVKGTLTNLGNKLGDTWSNLSNKVTNWVNTRKNNNSYSSTRMYGGKRKTRKSRKSRKHRRR